MSYAVPLPPRPNLAQYKKLAKDLLRAASSSDASAIREWAAHFPADTEWMERIWLQAPKPVTLTSAQFLLARMHGFASWPKFARHVIALEQANSPAAAFEDAADAIVTGNSPRLASLLAGRPELVRARSGRDHRSTLLHYVSANGIEDFRQKTPANIVELARMLLDAGSDVNAESDAYGGGSTALMLTATSYHPEAAGVQTALMELLIARGARFDSRTVNACLHNGRGAAAEFLASRGIMLDLEAAAGVGQAELVERLLPAALPNQVLDGFAWACEFGRMDVVKLLLDRGTRADAKLPRGETGLHWAAHGGHVEIVRMLLAAGARTDAVDERYGGTPLGWAKHGRPKTYDQVAALLSEQRL